MTHAVQLLLNQWPLNQFKNMLKLLYNAPFRNIPKCALVSKGGSFRIVPTCVELYFLAYYSFPSTTNEIKIYSRLGNIDYYKAKELANNGSIENVVQIGFYLSGDVTDDIGNRYNIESDSKTTYKVSIIFDRCKVVQLDCQCTNNKERLTRDITTR